MSDNTPPTLAVGDRVRVIGDTITGTVIECNPAAVIIRDDNPEYPEHDRLEFTHKEIANV